MLTAKLTLRNIYFFSSRPSQLFKNIIHSSWYITYYDKIAFKKKKKE